MRELENVFAALARSKFRARFKLGEKEATYLEKKGLEAILEHGRDFIAQRLAPASPRNDGNQTPMRGHPIFIAQHATATCCRPCLAKWHYVEAGRALTTEEREYVLLVLRRWLVADRAHRAAK